MLTTNKLMAATVLKSAVLCARVMYSSPGAMSVLARASHMTACCRVPACITSNRCLDMQYVAAAAAAAAGGYQKTQCNSYKRCRASQTYTLMRCHRYTRLADRLKP